MSLLTNPSCLRLNTYKIIIRSSILFSLVCFAVSLNGQIFVPIQKTKDGRSVQLDADVFLQIEKVNKVKSVKLTTGTELYFKLKEYPDTWRIADIQNILAEDNTLILDGNIYTLDEFSAVSIPRKPFARSLGKQLQNFGIVWSVLGGLATLADGDLELQTEEFAIGPGAFVIGTLLRMLPKRKKFNLEKNARLRIIDLRMITPEDY